MADLRSDLRLQTRLKGRVGATSYGTVPGVRENVETWLHPTMFTHTEDLTILNKFWQKYR
jgi:hypothetical protein